MKIKMPVMCGMQTHPTLNAQVAAAITAKDWPVDLDCQDTVMTTSMFCRYVLQIHKKVKAAGGRVRLLNVSDVVFEALDKMDLTRVFEVTRAATKPKTKRG